MKLQLDYVNSEDWRNEEEKKDLQSKNWKKIRSKVMKKFDFTCQYCGFKSHKWQIAHHINHKKGDNRLENITVMCQMCNVIHHSGFGSTVIKVLDLYKKSDYNQNDIVRITRQMRREGKKDKEIIKFLGLKNKVNFKTDRKYLEKLFGFVTSRFDDRQLSIKDNSKHS